MITEPEHLNCIKYFNLLKRLLGEGLVAVDWENIFYLKHPVSMLCLRLGGPVRVRVCVCASACICVCLFL